MGAIREVVVPDIGDFKDVPVIEVLVKPGDSVKAEDSLVTLESDKATMEVPAPFGGVVKEMRIKVGDKVSEGVLILTLEAHDGAQLPASKPAAPVAAPAAPAPPRGQSAPAVLAPAVVSAALARQTDGGYGLFGSMPYFARARVTVAAGTVPSSARALSAATATW